MYNHPDVYTVCHMFLEPEYQKVAIYSLKLGKEVWRGCATEVPEAYLYTTVESFDNLDKSEFLTMNIEI